MAHDQHGLSISRWQVGEAPLAIDIRILLRIPCGMNVLGNADKQEVGRWANNRVENSHLPFRRQERVMLRLRQMKTLKKFASVHANVHIHFNLERHLVYRQPYNERRSAALAVARQLSTCVKARTASCGEWFALDRQHH